MRKTVTIVHEDLTPDTEPRTRQVPGQYSYIIPIMRLESDKTPDTPDQVIPILTLNMTGGSDQYIVDPMHPLRRNTPDGFVVGTLGKFLREPGSKLCFAEPDHTGKVNHVTIQSITRISDKGDQPTQPWLSVTWQSQGGPQDTIEVSESVATRYLLSLKKQHRRPFSQPPQAPLEVAAAPAEPTQHTTSDRLHRRLASGFERMVKTVLQTNAQTARELSHSYEARHAKPKHEIPRSIRDANRRGARTASLGWFVIATAAALPWVGGSPSPHAIQSTKEHVSHAGNIFATTAATPEIQTTAGPMKDLHHVAETPHSASPDHSRLIQNLSPWATAAAIAGNAPAMGIVDRARRTWNSHNSKQFYLNTDKENWEEIYADGKPLDKPTQQAFDQVVYNTAKAYIRSAA